MTLVSDAPARETVAAEAPRPRPVMIVAAGAVIACGVALFFYTRSDMWLDEALTVNIARLPLGDLREALEHDGAPPLYYVLLHVWTGIFGDGDAAVRSLSGLFAAGALVACWFAARRFFGVRAAWFTVVVMATSPFVIRYATEARMYSLEILLVACGLLVLPSAFERPSFLRLASVAVVTALLVYAQYWGFFLVAVVGAALLVVAWRDVERRRNAIAVVAALGIGVLAFAPWLPTFLSQRAHTGTPWGEAVLPGLPIGETFLGFAGGEEQEGWLLLLVLVPILLLGVFARATDARHLEIDVRAQPESRGMALIGGATLVVAVSVNYLADQAFEPRYSALVFPFFALLVGRGIDTFVDGRIQVAVLAVVVGLGLLGGVRNVTEQRTQAGQVSAVLAREVAPGDLVVYCPDQLGPGVSRLLPAGLDQVTYPDFARPEFVDWVDYQERIDAADPLAFAAEVDARAGDNTIWLVSGPGYPNHNGACEVLTEQLGATRARTPRIAPDEDFFEKPGLQQFVRTDQ